MPKSREKTGLSRKVGVFALCLLCSLFFWLLTTLSESHTSEVKVKLRFSGIPPNLVIEGNEEREVTLKVKSKGFRLLSGMDFNKIDVPLFLPEEVLNGKSSRYVISLNRYLDAISSQISHEAEVIQVQPDTLLLSFRTFGSRKVPVLINSDIEFKTNYGFAGEILITPDSATVSGPEELIRPVHFIYTANPSGKISSDFSRSLALLGPTGVKITPENARVDFKVSELTEEELKIPVEVQNLPDSLLLRISPLYCTVTFQWPLEMSVNNETPGFSLIADFKKNANASLKKIKVETTGVPAYIRIIRVDPPSLDYVLEENTKPQ